MSVLKKFSNVYKLLKGQIRKCFSKTKNSWSSKNLGKLSLYL